MDEAQRIAIRGRWLTLGYELFGSHLFKKIDMTCIYIAYKPTVLWALH